MEILNWFIDFCKLFLIGWTITKFTPIKLILSSIEQGTGSVLIRFLITNLRVIFTCLKCNLLWIGLLFFNPWVALVTSAFGFIYDKYLSDWEKPKFKI